MEIKKRLFGQTKTGEAVFAFTLKNSVGTEATILTYGAAVQSLKFAGTDVVLGYDRLSDYETRDGYLGAVVGRYANRIAKGRFSLNQTAYSLAVNNGPNHLHGGIVGYSYRVWTVEELTGQKAVLTLESPDGEEGYPGALSLRVTYALEGSRLTKSHRIENHSSVEMLYELGAHDGFQAPLSQGEKMGDYAIRLPGLERVAFYGMDENLMLTPKGEEIPLNSSALPLTPSTFGLDTMILDTPPQAKAVLCDKAGQPRVALEFPDFPYLGIWTQGKPFDTGYVCIEPWSTLPDGTLMGREREDKTGIRRLAPGQSEELRYTTTIYEKGVYQHEA